MYISHQKKDENVGKQNIIEINGRRYDAHTGAALDPSSGQAGSASLSASSSSAPIQAARPIAKPQHHGHHHASRQAAKPATRHKQQRSATLMRRSVHKPGTSLKRRVNVQSNLSALAEQPSAKIAPKLSFNMTSPKRLELAGRVKRSDLIMHFSPDQPNYPAHKVSVMVSKPAPQPAATPKPVPRQAAPDIDDIFERAIQNATSHLEPTPKKTKRHRFHVGRKHARA